MTDNVSTVGQPVVSRTDAPAAPDRGVAATGGTDSSRPTRRFGGLSVIFPTDDRASAGRRGLLWAVLAVLVGAAVSLGHAGPGVNTFNVVFAEDGTYFLADAWNRSFFDAVLRPVAGYFVVVPRLLTEVASMAPLEWGPAVLSVEAAVVTALMAVLVYVASGAHLRGWLARLVAAAPVVAVAVGENDGATAANNVATLQFAALYVGLWVILWVPTRRRAQLTGVVVMLGIAVTTLLSVLLLPVALVRLYLRRDRMSATLVGGLLLGGAMNATALALHIAVRPNFLIPHYDSIWALHAAGQVMLPLGLLGYGPVRGGAVITIALAVAITVSVLIVLAVLALGLLRVTRPNWPLATVLVLHAVALFCASVMSAGRPEVRYVIAPELLLFAAMAAVLGPKPAAKAGPTTRPGSRVLAAAPLAVLAAFIVVVSALSYQLHSGRGEAAPWDQKIAQARAICTDTRLGAVNVYPLWRDKTPDEFLIGQRMPRVPPVGWPVRVPCSRLR